MKSRTYILFRETWFALLFAWLVLSDCSIAGQLTILHSFGGPGDGEAAEGGLVLIGSTLFGITEFGGPGNIFGGTVFAVNTDGSGYQLLHAFDGSSGDSIPFTGLTPVGSTLFGTTTGSDAGTVFSINSDGSGYRVVHNFIGGSGGLHPDGRLTVVGSTLFGTTSTGGPGGTGTIFSMNTDGSGFQVLHSFSDGIATATNMEAALTVVGSTIYGVTSYGGNATDGTVFAMNTDGSGFHVLHSFAGGSNDGAHPASGALALVGSTLIGTTRYGGPGDNGTIFSMNTDGSGFGLLHVFTAGAGSPQNDLTLVGSTLFSTASQPQVMSQVFEMNTDGTDFHPLDAQANSRVTISGSTLFGIGGGGQFNGGTVFSLVIPEPSSFVLAAFGFIALAWRLRRR